ncbi:hypothetical protein VTK73DRAFT_2707 [Phialemonium thermophilum]|uniref:Uncharacterized protein n=1 Tax=Phialemonium thermophilum TaxID=223376 RepID=A0ABR3VPR1_9PEZI
MVSVGRGSRPRLGCQELPWCTHPTHSSRLSLRVPEEPAGVASYVKVNGKWRSRRRTKKRVQTRDEWGSCARVTCGGLAWQLRACGAGDGAERCQGKTGHPLGARDPVLNKPGTATHGAAKPRHPAAQRGMEPSERRTRWENPRPSLAMDEIVSQEQSWKRGAERQRRDAQESKTTVVRLEALVEDGGVKEGPWSLETGGAGSASTWKCPGLRSNAVGGLRSRADPSRSRIRYAAQLRDLQSEGDDDVGLVGRGGRML